MVNLPELGTRMMGKAKPAAVVYVVDDHSEMCASIEALLSARGVFVQCFQSPTEFLQSLGSLASGVVLLDMRMPEMNGLEVLAAMKGCLREFPVVMITGHGEIEDAVKSIKAGAKDFLQKPFKADALLSILDTEWNALTNRAANEASNTSLDTLSPRERDVVLELAKGKPNKVIAHDLGISVRTVEMHRARAMNRLNCRTFADLLRKIFQDAPKDDAYQNGWSGK